MVDDEEPTEINMNPELDGKTARELQLEKEIEELKKTIERLQKKDEPINEYKEIFIKPITDDDLEAELLALSSSENIVVQPRIIDDVSSLDDLRKMDALVKAQKKKK